MESKDVQPMKVCVSILGIELPSFIVFNPVEFLKAYRPSYFTELGTSIDVRHLNSKAALPIFSREEGSLIDVKIHSLNER